jgi:3-deoxy-7-phosphoheptulonate synthase
MTASNLDWGKSKPLPTPRELKRAEPVSDELAVSIDDARHAASAIMCGEDSRFLVIAGPCSVHDEEATVAYARELAALQREVSDDVLCVMRVYMEKPRTQLGWTGLINDPYMDGSGDMEEGLRRARRILRRCGEAGLKYDDTALPCATEVLDPLIPFYLADLVSFAAIGARTVESQIHRQLASALTMPVGFKNTRSGDTQAGVDAMVTAAHAHTISAVTEEGELVFSESSGNPDSSVILRGGTDAPNYGQQTVRGVRERIRESSEDRLANQHVIVDCSHDNMRAADGSKDQKRQPDVFRAALEHRRAGEEVCGVMLESHFREGKQAIPSGEYPDPFISVTDPCIDIETTKELTREAGRL